MQSRYYDANVGRFISPDAMMSGVSGSLDGFNLYAYCFNNPVMMADGEGNWPKNWDEAKAWLKKKFKKVKEEIKEVTSILCTKEFAKEIVNIAVNNIVADLGVCIGAGFEVEIGDFTIEAISRMDIIGVQFKNGKVRLGRDGRSALTVSWGPFTIGPQSDTYESFDGEADDPIHSFADIGWSEGSAIATPVGGYHANFSISCLGVISDVIQYVRERRN